VASEALRRAQELLSIEDVYLRDAHALTHPDYDPIAVNPDIPELSVQINCSPNLDVKQFTSEAENKSQLRIRYAVETQLRLVKPDPTKDVNQEPAEDDVVAIISATFLLRYIVRGDTFPTKELTDAFADNAVHHMWPYWREFLQATTGRLRLPPIVLPVRVVRRRRPAEAPAPTKE
jgi:hypothetical protein